MGPLGHFALGHEVYKSIALGNWTQSEPRHVTRACAVCSEDTGRSWSRRGQVLTVGGRPSPPAWAGIGDFDIVWDWQQHRCGPGRGMLC